MYSYLTTSCRTLVSHAVNNCCILSPVMFLSSCNWMENCTVSDLPGIVSRYWFNRTYGKHFKLKTKVLFQVNFKRVPGTEEFDMTLYWHVMKWYVCSVTFWKTSDLLKRELLVVYIVSLSMEDKWADWLSVVKVSTKRPPKFIKQLRSNCSCKIRNKKHSLPFTM